MTKITESTLKDLVAQLRTKVVEAQKTSGTDTFPGGYLAYTPSGVIAFDANNQVLGSGQDIAGATDQAAKRGASPQMLAAMNAAYANGNGINQSGLSADTKSSTPPTNKYNNQRVGPQPVVGQPTRRGPSTSSPATQTDVDQWNKNFGTTHNADGSPKLATPQKAPVVDGPGIDPSKSNYGLKLPNTNVSSDGRITNDPPKSYSGTPPLVLPTDKLGQITNVPPTTDKGGAALPDTDRPGLKRGGTPEIYDWQKRLGVTPDGYWGDQTDQVYKQKPEIKPPAGVTRNWPPATPAAPAKPTPKTATPGADAVLAQPPTTSTTPIPQQEFSFTPGSPEEKKFYNDRGLNPPVNGAPPVPLPGASLNIPQQPGVGPKDEEERKRWIQDPTLTAPKQVTPAPVQRQQVPQEKGYGIKSVPDQGFGQITDSPKKAPIPARESTELARWLKIAGLR